MTLVPSDLLGADREVLPPLLIRLILGKIAEPQLQRIHLQAIRQFVDDDFRDEKALRMAWRPEGALRSRVDVDVAMGSTPVRPDVDLIRQREPRAGAGAASSPRLRVPRNEFALRIRARAHLRVRRRTVPGDQVLGLAVEHDLDRRVRRFRELRGDEDLHVLSELAPESTAHVIGNHAHVRLRHLQRVREAFTRRIDPLGRHPRRQLVAVPLAEAAVRLEAGVGLHLCLIQALDHVLRCLQGRLDVPLLLERRLGDVAGDFRGRRRAGGGRSRRARLRVDLEDLRRIGRHRLLHRREVRQHVVVHLDPADRVLRGLLGRRRDGGDFFSLVMGLSARFDAGDRGLHPRHLLRVREIDALDARVRVRRSEDPPVQHAGTDDVVGVLRPAGHFVRAVDALDRFAEQGAVARSGPASHESPPSSRC